MKVAVITRHAITNYGSLLQAMATQSVIEDLGHTCEIIDYIRNDESYYEREKTLLKKKNKWNSNLLKRAIYLILRQPESILAGKKFEKYRKKYLKLTSRYTSLNQLIEDAPKADVYVTGSDQVWGPVENGSYDSSYCLSFVEDKYKKISYAASFGRTEMTDEVKKYYRMWLEKYAYVSVREESAVALIEDMGLKVKQVLDPTLLLDGEYWSRFIEKIPYENYILVYQLHNDKKLNKYAKKVAKEMKLPLIRVSATFHQIFRGGKFIYLPNVGEFLAYVKNAKCIITDSFHGTAFAINFNTQFVEILPNNRTDTRNISILNIAGLKDRILQCEDDVELARNIVDFSYANKVIASKRDEAIKTMKSMLEE